MLYEKLNFTVDLWCFSTPLDRCALLISWYCIWHASCRGCCGCCIFFFHSFCRLHPLCWDRLWCDTNCSPNNTKYKVFNGMPLTTMDNVVKPKLDYCHMVFRFGPQVLLNRNILDSMWWSRWSDTSSQWAV